ncbi:uncharacterized protein JCM6883_005471 [Sporobolomyces salmoneus]|uniref:uncharacterized protein n=1 Tax=Sporobolomyces salmoneus TaxID=183962 RepID=UPI00317DDBE1
MPDSFAYLTKDDYKLLRPLACQLFPPFDAARDYLVETALDSLHLSQDTLKNDYAYQHIQFRDKRKLENALSSIEAELGKGNEKPKLELTRSQIEDLKRHRRTINEASRAADRDYDNKPIENRKKLMNGIKESSIDEKETAERARQEIGAKRDILHDLLVRDRSPSPEPFSMSFFAPSPPSPEPPNLSHTSDSSPLEGQHDNVIPFDAQEEHKSVSMEVEVSAESVKDAATSTLAETSLGAESQPFGTSAVGGLPSRRLHSSSVVAEESGELQSFRLSLTDFNLPFFDSKPLDWLTSLAPSVPAGSLRTLSYSIEWNPLADVTKIPLRAPTTLTLEERSKAQEVREAAQDLFDGLMQSPRGETDELRDEIRLTAPATPTTLALHATPPFHSPSQFADFSQSPFPPPYTLYKRRANSLPPPSSCSQLLFDSPPARSVEISDRQVPKDEFGFVQAELRPSGPDSPPVYARERESNGHAEASDSRKAFDPIAKLNSTRQEESSLQLATSSQLSESLDRFMRSRGRSLLTAPSRTSSNGGQQSRVANTASDSQAAFPRSPVSLPLPTPPFVSSPLPPSPLPILRVIVFDHLLQTRSLSSALEKLQFQLVHRPSRFPPSRFTIQNPHLIMSGTSCVFYFKLIDLIGNAVRADPPDSTKLTRQESIFSTLRRFSSLYNHVLVVFEEQQAFRRSSTSVKPYSYTPVVLEGLVRLAEALKSLSEDGQCQVHVVCSSGAESSAELTRRFAEFVKSEDEKEARPGIPAWGNRIWLPDDPQPEGSSLLMLSPLLNELVVCGILSLTLPDEFLKLSQEDLESTFSSVCGNERIHKIWSSIHLDETPQTLSCIALKHPSPSNSGDTPLRLQSPDGVDAIASGDLRLEDVFDVVRYDEDSGIMTG